MPPEPKQSWDKIAKVLGVPPLIVVLGFVIYHLFARLETQRDKIEQYAKEFQSVVAQNTIAFREASDSNRSLKNAVDSLSDNITRMDRRASVIDGDSVVATKRAHSAVEVIP